MEEQKNHSLFEVHLLNQKGLEKAHQIGLAFSKLLMDLEVIVGSGQTLREFSIVRTKLEEAAFFCKKAMAVQGENQDRGN